MSLRLLCDTCAEKLGKVRLSGGTVNCRCGECFERTECGKWGNKK